MDLPLTRLRIMLSERYEDLVCRHLLRAGIMRIPSLVAMLHKLLFPVASAAATHALKWTYTAFPKRSFGTIFTFLNVKQQICIARFFTLLSCLAIIVAASYFDWY